MKKIVFIFLSALVLFPSCSKMDENLSGIYLGKQCVMTIRSAFSAGSAPTSTKSIVNYLFFNENFSNLISIPDSTSCPLSILRIVDMSSGDTEETMCFEINGVLESGDVNVTLENGVYANSDEKIKDVKYKFIVDNKGVFDIDITMFVFEGKNIRVRYTGPIESSGLD